MNRLKLWMKNTMILNPWLKLLALLMAVFTFHAIRGETSDEAVQIVPVEAQPADPDRIVLDQNPLFVSLTLRGARDDLKKLDAQEIKVVVKLRGKEDGSVPIRRRDIRGISGVRVAKIEPDKVTVVTADAVVPPLAQDNPALERGAGTARVAITARHRMPVAVLAPDGSFAEDFFTNPAAVDIVVSGTAETHKSFSADTPFIYVEALDPEEPDATTRKVQLRKVFPTGTNIDIRPSSVLLYRHRKGDR